MSIFIDESTRLVVQGITGRDGGFHTRQMIEYGTQVVAGVTPGKGGQLFDDSVPVFDTVAEAVKQHGANTSVVYVPAAFAADAPRQARLDQPSVGSDCGARLMPPSGHCPGPRPPPGRRNGALRRWRRTAGP